MMDDLPAVADSPQLSAYDLLSTPTLDLTDDQVALVVADLRKRRELYIKTGKPDKIAKPKAIAGPKAKLDAAEKARNTAALMAQLKLTKDGDARRGDSHGQ